MGSLGVMTARISVPSVKWQQSGWCGLSFEVIRPHLDQLCILQGLIRVVIAWFCFQKAFDSDRMAIDKTLTIISGNAETVVKSTDA